LSSFGQFRQ